MDLKLKEVAELLKLSEKTIYRWVKDGKIPCYRINHQYRFRTDEINQWAVSNKYAIMEIGVEQNSSEPVSVLNSLDNGGIYYHISGNNITEILTNAVSLINMPVSLGKETVLMHLIKREDMASTAIGNGIAFPHPRNPMVSDTALESLSICFLNTPIKDYSLDNIPIHTLIIILSATQKRHLQMLSKLSFLCRQEKFTELLKTQVLREKIIDYIKNCDL